VWGRGGAADPVGPEPKPHAPEIPALRRAASVLLVLDVLVFVGLDYRVGFRWDGFLIWASRAQLLHFRGALTPWPGTLPTHMLGLKLYNPPAIPLFEALVASLEGRFDFDALKPIFVLFFASLLIGTYRLARNLSSPSVALATVAVVGMLPGLIGDSNIAGNADMPLAAGIATAAAATLEESGRLRSWRAPAPWLIASLVTIKREGVIDVAAALVAYLAFGPGRGRGARAAARWVVPSTLAVLWRVAYLGWIRSPGSEEKWVPLAKLPHHIVVATRAAAPHLVDLARWGALWPASVAAIVVALGAGSRRLGFVAAWAAVAFVADIVPFVYTIWNVPVDVASAYPRLLEHHAALAASVAAAVLYQTATGPRRRLWGGAGATVAAATALLGIRQMLSEAVIDFRWAPAEAIPAEMIREASEVRRLSGGTPIVYVGNRDAEWTGGLWQRALFPQDVFLALPRTGPLSATIRQARLFGARDALCQGSVPPDLQLEWTRELPAVAPFGTVVFGRLAPAP
jgi:hypothetical protein